MLTLELIGKFCSGHSGEGTLFRLGDLVGVHRRLFWNIIMIISPSDVTTLNSPQFGDFVREIVSWILAFGQRYLD